MKKDILKALSQLTQVGLSVVVPVTLCLVLAGWLMKKYDLGTWVVIVGAVLGAGSGFLNIFNLSKTIMKKDDE